MRDLTQDYIRTFEDVFDSGELLKSFDGYYDSSVQLYEDCGLYYVFTFEFGGDLGDQQCFDDVVQAKRCFKKSVVVVDRI